MLKVNIMELIDRIIVDSKIMVGKPIIKGTRITVQQILNLLAQGISYQEILEDYPKLSEIDIRACIAYASKSLEDSTFMPLNI